MFWKNAVLDALRRYSERHNTNTVIRSKLIREEIGNIVKDTRSKGRTPEQTLSRIMQELRDDGYVHFVDDDGTYEINNL
ncbi:MAG TPA: hypothetical protein ENO22_00195 [candidate division Zixibacteria bacterium]|mgnify:CR=1 FL=1|nr:hypothetical protein [candidate division Zixibacteria bacterium]HEQ97746.1 hypothetical protein [candidate division Zixibacteria bacterium]